MRRKPPSSNWIVLLREFNNTKPHLSFMTQDYFCSQCGNKLEPHMQFCPKCGTVIAGSAAEEQMIADQQSYYMEYQENKMSVVFFALAIYAIPALIFGLIILLNADLAASTIWTDIDFQNWLLAHADEVSITESDFKTYFNVIGGMCTISGIAGIVSMVTIGIRKYWIVSTAACFISTVLCIWSVFGFIIGLFVSLMILGAKDFFYKDYATKLGE